MLYRLKETIVLCSCLRKQCAGYYWQPIAAVCWTCLHTGECFATLLCLSQLALHVHVQSKRLCIATRHMDELVCARTSLWCLGFLPLCPDAVPHACSLSGFVLLPLHLSVSRVLSRSPAEQRRGSAPVSTKGFLLRAAAAAQASCEDERKHQCSVTSRAGLQRNHVTFDRFKTPAPLLIGFPEPPTFLCFQPCSYSPFYFVWFCL